MRSHGNGNVALCAANLVKTVRGTVPYERYKGLAPTIIDLPVTDYPRVQAAVERLLSIYEPRIESLDVTLSAPDAENGRFEINLDVT